MVELKDIIKPHLSNVKLALLDQKNLYNINGLIISHISMTKLPFDKFASIDGILGTSLSIRHNKPQILITPNGLLGDITNKTALFVADVPSHEVLSAISLIRSSGGICNTCIVVMDDENMLSDTFKNNKVEVYPLIKKSDFGVF
jgi:hypothetical protein